MSLEVMEPLAEEQEPESFTPAEDKPPAGLDEPKLTSIMAGIAIERAGGRRAKRPPEPLTLAQMRTAKFEEAQAAAMEEDIAVKLGPNIYEFLARLEVSGRLRDGMDLKVAISNTKLLELLSQNGYISPEMAEEGNLDLTGLIAGQLLTSKNVLAASKRVMVGPYRHLVKRVIDKSALDYVTYEAPE